MFGDDGEELDVYDVPVEEYTARIIGIIHRHNDLDGRKLISAPEEVSFGQNKILELVSIQEQYYESEIKLCN